MTQGDSYSVPFTLTSNGQALDLTAISLIEFCLGNLTKNYPEVVTYDQSSGKFYIPLTQQETFNFKPDGTEYVQARIKFTDNTVIATQKWKRTA